MTFRFFSLKIKSVFLLLAFPIILMAQIDFKKEFKINHKGEANPTPINQLIKERDYQVISAFDTVSHQPVLVYAIYIKKNKFGILDIQGKEITPAIYDDIPALNRDYTYSISGFKKYFTVVKNRKYGVIDQHGKTLIPPTYHHIGYTTYKYANINPPNGDEDEIVFEARLDDNNYFLNHKNKIVKPSTPVDDTFVDVDNGTTPPQKKIKTTTPYGKVVRTFQKRFQSIAKKADGKTLHGLYNSRTEKLILKPNFLKVEEGSDHHFILQNKNEKYGVVDSLGRTVLKFQYDKIYDLIRTHYAVFKKDKMALFSRNFKQLTKFEYESSSSSNAHYFSFYKNGKQGVVTSQGKEITDFVFDRVRFFMRDNKKPLIIATINRKQGIIDSLGNVLLDFEYDVVLPDDKGKAEAYSIRRIDDFTGTTNPQFYFYKKNRRCGIYNDQFEVVLEGYDNIIKSRVKDLIYISKERKWGIYNLKTQQMILPIEMDRRIRYYRGGYFNFDKYFSGGFFVVYKNGKFGLYDGYGKEWLPCEVDQPFEVELIYNGLIRIEGQDGYFYMDGYGNRTKRRRK